MLLDGSQQITQITQIIFLPTEIIFANGEHEEHEVFSQQIFFIANGEHEEHEVFYLVNRLHRLHRLKDSHQMKRMKLIICVICVIC